MRPRALFISASAAGLVLALGAKPTMAQHMNAKDAPCRDVVVTAEMAACFSKAAKSRDAELAALLTDVRPAIGDKLLDRTQAAWLNYRKLACEGEHDMYEGGSAAPTVKLACLEALTRDRIKQLHDGYDWWITKNR